MYLAKKDGMLNRDELICLMKRLKKIESSYSSYSSYSS